MIKSRESWKLDRRIPLAVIIMLILQIASALVWATQLDARVSNMEHQSISIISVNEKFIRLEERLDHAGGRGRDGATGGASRAAAYALYSALQPIAEPLSSAAGLSP